jgi:Tfp pilus assembly protein PilN
VVDINLLPKNQRRSKEPVTWRLITALVPLMILTGAALMQLQAQETERQLEGDRALRQLRLDSLREDLAVQHDLQERQRQLNELMAIAASLRDRRIIWSDEFYAMLETLPGPDTQGQPRLAFSSLVMQPLSQSEREARVSDSSYDGAEPLAEMSIQGVAVSTQVLSDYIAALQNSPSFGVAFNSTSRQEDSSMYDFTMTIGALAEGR